MSPDQTQAKPVILESLGAAIITGAVAGIALTSGAVVGLNTAVAARSKNALSSV